MSLTRIAPVVIPLVIILVLFLRARLAKQPKVPLSELPAIVSRLQASGAQNDAYACFAFAAAGEPNTTETCVELQYSIADGRLGIDWELKAPRNLADKDRVADFIRSQHHVVTELQGWRVPYLRVEDGDLVALGTAIARQLYGLSPESLVELWPDGFTWQGPTN